MINGDIILFLFGAVAVILLFIGCCFRCCPCNCYDNDDSETLTFQYDAMSTPASEFQLGTVLFFYHHFQCIMIDFFIEPPLTSGDELQFSTDIKFDRIPSKDKVLHSMSSRESLESLILVRNESRETIQSTLSSM